MVMFRRDLDDLTPYTPGRPIEDVARQHGISEIIKLASNECPLPPLAPVQRLIAARADGANRYPDTNAHDLRQALATHHSVDPSTILVGAGSTDLLRCIATVVGGAGTSAVYGNPSFLMYPIITALAGAEAIEVPLDHELRHDLDAMLSAIRDDTTVVYVCNPNNPTGTHLPRKTVTSFVDAVPDDVLIIIDEAYHDFVTVEDHETAMDLVASHPNVVVARTFSKVHGLAGLRVGYAIGQADVLAHIARAQMPFSVSTLAQLAATESLRHRDELAARVKENALGRDYLEAGLQRRGIAFAQSQTNFVLIDIEEDAQVVFERLQERGIIVRTAGTYLRITVGTLDELSTFLSELDALMETS